MHTTSEDQVLLRQGLHVMTTEAAGVLGLLRLGALAPEEKSRRVYLRTAIQRLEAQCEYLSSLAIEPNDFVRADDVVERLSQSIACWHDVNHSKRLVVSPDEVTVAGDIARCLGLITAELVTNGFRHALERGASYLRVILRHATDDVVLNVMDDGPGFPEGFSVEQGRGLSLSSNLARGAGGSLRLGPAGLGTMIKVTLPLG